MIKEEISIGLILQTTSSDIKRMVGIQIRSFSEQNIKQGRSWDRRFLQKGKRVREEVGDGTAKRKDNLDFHLKKNPSNSYASIPICVMHCVKFKLENIKIKVLTQSMND